MRGKEGEDKGGSGSSMQEQGKQKQQTRVEQAVVIETEKKEGEREEGGIHLSILCMRRRRTCEGEMRRREKG